MKRSYACQCRDSVSHLGPVLPQPVADRPAHASRGPEDGGHVPAERGTVAGALLQGGQAGGAAQLQARLSAPLAAASGTTGGSGQAGWKKEGETGFGNEF